MVATETKEMEYWSIRRESWKTMWRWYNKL